MGHQALYTINGPDLPMVWPTLDGGDLQAAASRSHAAMHLHHMSAHSNLSGKTANLSCRTANLSVAPTRLHIKPIGCTSKTRTPNRSAVFLHLSVRLRPAGQTYNRIVVWH